MLRVTLGGNEYYDEGRNVFYSLERRDFEFEYSLKAIFEWEGLHLKPYLNTQLQSHEMISFIKCMCLTDIPDMYIDDYLITNIIEYLNKQDVTATKIKAEKATSRKIVTSETIYASLADLGLDPGFYEQWHISRLFTLISVIQINRGPKKKMTQQEIIDKQRRLNEERKRKLNTKG